MKIALHNKLFLVAILTLAWLLVLPAQAGSEITYLHNDALGSPVAGTDEQGNVKWRSYYQPYGLETTGQRQTQGEKTGFTGHQEDGDTGLVYMGARYYSPVLGRFMAVDPVGVDEANIHSFNRFAYANNNPYGYIDPDGRAAETPYDIVSFGISLEIFRRDPSLVNGLGLAYDGVAAVFPFLPAGFGVIKGVGNGIDAAGDVTNKTTKEVLTRKAKGADGGKSQQIIERDASGDVLSRTHKVTTNGKTVHQHQNHVGKEGGVRQFPDEWTGTKTINAPYENIAPKFPADRVPGGRKF